MKNLFLTLATTFALLTFVSCSGTASTGGVQAEKSAKCGTGKCGDGKKEVKKKCGDGKKEVKAKCGDAKKEVKAKCGTGKCGDGK